MPKPATLSRVLTPASSSVDRSVPFDVGAFTLQARTKLLTLSFLPSQLDVQLDTDNDVYHGLAWMLDDIRESLTLDTEAGGAA
jgi:hypothetical protein